MSKHIVFIVGEESGDQHAAKLFQSLLNIHPDLRASGLGGGHLQALGMHNLMDLTRLAITGLTGVFAHAGSIAKAFKLIKKHLLQNSPDLIILVDNPGFNLRMAKWIKKNLSCPVLYYISPQVWAWKANRIETIRRCVEHIAVILPFEFDIYQKNNIPVTYVGHPLLDSLKNIPSKQQCREYFSWSTQEKVLAICPGSRDMEVSRHMPVLVKALTLLQNSGGLVNTKIVIPVAKSLDIKFVGSFLVGVDFSYELVSGQAQYVMQASDAVVVASGTASLESAILLKPTCIIYKSNWLNYYLAQRVMKVRYLGLGNLLLNRMAIPELLQTDCNPQELAKMMDLLVNVPKWRHHLESQVGDLKQLLMPQDPDLLTKLTFSIMDKSN